MKYMFLLIWLFKISIVVKAQVEISPFLDSVYQDNHPNPQIKTANYANMTFAQAIVSCRNLEHNGSKDWYLPTLDEFMLFIRPTAASLDMVTCEPATVNALGCRINTGTTNEYLHLRFYHGIVMDGITPKTLDQPTSVSPSNLSTNTGVTGIPYLPYDYRIRLDRLSLLLSHTEVVNPSTESFLYNTRAGNEDIQITDLENLGRVRCVR